ncbi:hypothetical protein D3218_08875 [Aureimonas flava]|uniref:Polysaccharide chain length determinant N-terminal domain-containing protein n=1 Tax=Aureimonas flava TaxID=2320271 RepID=A0A3A1WLZ4_9HYPH|nr:hypothetical protein [Aureimonas flava]RIY01455.1 hypothetical protein D3218_08875 [Aureimonas flava]
MTDRQRRIERGASLARVLWSNRARIVLSTGALGFAAFLAGSLIPPFHRATIRVAAAPEVSAQWTDAVLRDVAAEQPGRTNAARAGVLAAWADLIDQSSTLRPDSGVERADDGAVLVWAEDHEADAARRRAEAMADRLVARIESRGPAAGVSEPTRSDPQPTPAGVQALDASIAKARIALADAQARLAEAQTEAPAAGDAAARRRTSLDAGRRAAEAARQELQETERFARELPGAAPSAAPPAVQGRAEWRNWRDVRARRDAVAAQAAELSRTLLDGHPRMAMVRLRLDDLEGEVGTAARRLADALGRRVATLRREADRLDRTVASEEAADGADEAARTRREAAAAQVDAARRTLDALETARSAAEAEAASEPAVQAVAPEVSAVPFVSTSLAETEYRPDIWPIVAGSAALGFLVSSLYAVVAAPRPQPVPAAPSEIAVRGRRRGAVREDGEAAGERRAGSLRFDITPADELVGGILASEIGRVVIVPIGSDERPAAVEIVRRLALRGRPGALVDLSERQLAACAMGVAPDALGVSDMIAGDATFAEIARPDFATLAEAFGAGRAKVEEAAFLAMERRNVLDFIERNYEVVLVVCGGMPLETVKSLLTPEAALVVTVEGEDEDGIAAGTARLRAAGLADMILADGRQLAT